MNEKATDVDKFDERGVEIVPSKALTSQAPASMYELTLTRGGDLDKLEKFMNLQIKWEEREAKKAFTKAMAAFKANPPEIHKDKKNLQFDSMYTSLSELVNNTIPKLSEQGFSHNWQYSTAENGNPEVTCILTHELGHSISVKQDAPPLQSKNKSGQVVTNPIQQVKSTQTYLKITTFEAVTGLVSQDANLDDNGNAVSEIEYISEKQLSSIVDMINAKEIDEGKFLEHMEVKSADKIQASEFDRAMKVLKKAKGKSKREPGQEG